MRWAAYRTISALLYLKLVFTLAEPNLRLLIQAPIRNISPFVRTAVFAEVLGILVGRKNLRNRAER